MSTSVQTSKLLDYRAREIVPLHLEKMKQAITDKDWSSLCEITMKESNSLHA
jgi:diphosphomevalonate decarboxylase